jgi:hypothetical protein
MEQITRIHPSTKKQLDVLLYQVMSYAREDDILKLVFIMSNKTSIVIDEYMKTLSSDEKIVIRNIIEQTEEMLRNITDVL